MKNPDLKRLKDREISQWVDQLRKVKPKGWIVDDMTGAPKRQEVSSGLEVYSGDWDRSAVAHLLKRTLFGAKKEEIDRFEGLSLADSISQLIQEDPDPLPPVNDYHYPEGDIIDPDVAQGESWIRAPYNNELEGYRIVSLKSWMINNMINQPSTIHEKLILFWHNLLVTQTWDVFIAKSSYQYFKMLRENSLGNFKTLIKKLTLDPSMLIYLNGTFNNKEAPDENYARELQELFCIGKGPDAAFTEGDVQAAARVLTGWVIDWESLQYEGTPRSFFYHPYHYTNDKQFSSFYGDQLIEGQTGEAGQQELDALLDMIFDNPETSRYICRRLYQFFVYSEIDEATEQNVILPLAKIFRDSNYEIMPVLESLFASAHFFDEANRGAMIKNPADFLLGMWRTMDIERLGEPNSFERLVNHQSMMWTMAEQGMELGDPPSVSGWPAYYQSPVYDKYWITTDTITNRAISTDSLWYWGFWINQNVQIRADLVAFLDTLDQPEDPNILLDQLSELFLGIEISQESLNQLKLVLLSGQTSDYYWTNAWLEMKANPEDQEALEVVLSRLRPTFQNLFQLGECQLM